MATRASYPGLQAPGEVLTDANFDRMPGGWILYVEVTANQNTISGETDLTSLTGTATPSQAAGRKHHYRAYCRVLQNTSTGIVTLRLKEGATVRQIASMTLVAAAEGVLMISWFVTDTAARTVKLSLQTSAGTVNLVAGATSPASLLVTDEGPAS